MKTEITITVEKGIFHYKIELKTFEKKIIRKTPEALDFFKDFDKLKVETFEKKGVRYMGDFGIYQLSRDKYIMSVIFISRKIIDIKKTLFGIEKKLGL